VKQEREGKPSLLIINETSMLYWLLSFVIVILVLAVAIYLVKLLLDFLELDAKLRQIFMVGVAIVAVIVLIIALSSFPITTCKSLFCR
jgi:hypothetical protein